MAALGLVQEAVCRVLPDYSLVDVGLRKPQLLDIMSNIHAGAREPVPLWNVNPEPAGSG